MPGDIINVQRLSPRLLNNVFVATVDQESLERGGIEVEEMFGFKFHPSVFEETRRPGVQGGSGDEDDASRAQ